MTTILRSTAALAAILLALGGCEKSSSGGARLDSPNTGAGNSATGATGGTATSTGAGGTTAGNNTAATPGTSTGATAPRQPADQARPKDSPPPY